MFSKQKFNAVISLGQECQVAYQVQRKGLRKFSGPLDWFITPMPSLLTLLTNGFEGFMEFGNLQILSEAKGHYVVVDRRYDVQTLHDFNVNSTNSLIFDEYLMLSQKLQKRIQRFYRHVETADSLLFIRSIGSKEEFIELYDILSYIRKGKQTTLFALDQTQEIAYDWGYGTIKNFKITILAEKVGPNFWKGLNKEWDNVLKDVALTQRNIKLIKEKILGATTVQKGKDVLKGMRSRVGF